METDDFYDVIDATWPAKSKDRSGPWTLREGSGGGKRVSAATTVEDVDESDIAAAEATMKTQRQTPLFSIREGQEELDRILKERGYRKIDLSIVLAMSVAELSEKPIPPVTAFPIWPGMAIQDEIWDAGGIGPERRAVMERAETAKTTVFGRTKGRAAGTLFAACHQKTAMIHAVEVLPEMRRNGLARDMAIATAHWALSQGADTLATIATSENSAAQALYRSLGMSEVARYHYRAYPSTG